MPTPAVAANPSSRRSGTSRHYAWVILAVSFVGLLSSQGVRLAFGAFVVPWEDTFGITRGDVGAISLVSYLVYGAVQPIVGRYVERVDIPRLFAAGLAIIAAGLMLTSRSGSVPLVYASFGVISSIGFGVAASVTASVLIARWFVARRGLAFGILEAGFGAGQLVFTPVALFAITRYGWRSTMTGFSLVIGFVAIPLVLGFLRNRPSDMGLEPLGGPDLDVGTDADERPLAILARREFWLLGLPFFVCGITTTGLIDTHLIPFAHNHGASDTVTSAAVATLAIFNIVGTAGAGLLVDHYDPRKMLGVLYLVRAVSLLVVLVLNEGFWLIQFGVVFGLVDFATVAPTQTLVTRYFGPQTLGFVFGLVLASHQVGSALGAYIPGMLFDLTGDYRAAFVSASALLLVASALSFTLPTPLGSGSPGSPGAPLTTQ